MNKGELGSLGGVPTIHIQAKIVLILGSWGVGEFPRGMNQPKKFSWV